MWKQVHAVCYRKEPLELHGFYDSEILGDVSMSLDLQVVQFHGVPDCIGLLHCLLLWLNIFQ